MHGWCDQCSIPPCADDLFSIQSNSKFMIRSVFYPAVHCCFHQYPILPHADDLIILPSYNPLMIRSVFYLTVCWWFNQYSILQYSMSPSVSHPPVRWLIDQYNILPCAVGLICTPPDSTLMIWSKFYFTLCCWFDQCSILQCADKLVFRQIVHWWVDQYSVLHSADN